MNEYLKAQNKTNETVINGTFSTNELDRLSKSDFRWAHNRNRNFQCRTVKKGEIYQFEFGKNFIPEMSYEHRGLVIGAKKKMLYVLPIFSYDPRKHPDVFHPIDFPNSKSDLFLLKSNEFSFISHHSVLKLNDIRTVSINRILYSQNEQISPESDTYKQIETLVLQKYFPTFYYDFNQCKLTISSLNAKAAKLEEINNNLTSENEKLKAEIKDLKTKAEPPI